MLTMGSLFAGIGGIDLAFTQAGFDVRWQVEIDPFCRSVLAHHWPRAERYEDVTAIQPGELPRVDVIAAGFPCQPFSIAGKGLGVNDERYLAPAMLEVIKDVRPAVVFLENVPRFATLDDGHAFKQLLRELAEVGYDATWEHLRARDAGAPHVRERWFLVAYTDRRHAHKPSAIQDRIQNKVRYIPASYARRSQLVHAAGSGGEDVAHPDPAQLAHQRQSQTARIYQPYGARKRHALADTTSPRLSVRLAARKRKNAAQSRTGLVARSKRHGARSRHYYRVPQPRLGRNAHGIPAGLDRHRWPAPPGPQPAWEPSRVIASPKPQHRPRLQALGNAVVPQVIFPIAQAIAEYLREEYP